MPISKSRGLISVLFLVGIVAVASAASFQPLFTLPNVVGEAKVIRPDNTEVPALKGHAYPYGSKIVVSAPLPPPTLREVARARKRNPAWLPPAPPEVTIELSRDFRFRLKSDSAVTVINVSEGDELDSMLLDLHYGTLDTIITAIAAKGSGLADAEVDKNLTAITVRTPMGDCTSLSERNRIEVGRPDSSGFIKCSYRTNNGKMQITGPQYEIKDFKINAVAEVLGSKDYTCIESANSEFSAILDQGASNKYQVRFKSGIVGKIWREYAEVGGRMAVSVLVSYPNRDPKSYSFLEGDEVTDVGDSNSGDEVSASNSSSDDGFGDSGFFDDNGSSSGSDDFGSSDDGFNWDF